MWQGAGDEVASGDESHDLLVRSLNHQRCIRAGALLEPRPFGASIRNENTRKAYGRALASFFLFIEDGGTKRVQDIGPLNVRDYLEAAKAAPDEWVAEQERGGRPQGFRRPDRDERDKDDDDPKKR